MTKTDNAVTAKIYTFPARGTYPAAPRFGSLAPQLGRRPDPARPLSVASTGWYHDEAIRDADPSRRA